MPLCACTLLCERMGLWRDKKKKKKKKSPRLIRRIFLFLKTSSGKKGGKGNVFMREKKLFYTDNVQSNGDKSKLFFIRKNEEGISNHRTNKHYLGSISNTEKRSASSFYERLKRVKDSFFFFLKREKNIFDRLKELYGKESIWFISGYAKNIFCPNSFYNIVGFEQVKEIDTRKWTQTNKINFDYLLQLKRRIEQGGEIRKENEEKKRTNIIVNVYKAKKYVIFYKGRDQYNSLRTDNTSNNSNDFILCTYVYLIFHIYDKEKKKLYVCANGPGVENGGETVIYEVKEMEKDNFPKFLSKNVGNKKILKNINIVSLLRKKGIFNSMVRDPSCDELLNAHNYTNRFNSYLKRLLNMCSNTEMSLKSTVNTKELQKDITFIFGKTNFLFKKKTLLDFIKSFFLKNDHNKHLYEHMFKNNKGYKFYIQNDFVHNSSYALTCTKIAKNKIEKLFKLISNTYNKKGSYIDPFFTYCKILFQHFKNEYENKKRKQYSDGEIYNERSVLIHIGSDNYAMDEDLLSQLKNANEALLFAISKHFLNTLISCVHL
ncbi:conserved Plasmodium protein, unknown function [Plasmodium ovale wallikeri]|uniref:Uncharacterized protein n=2 Tax=Plasmodium ovale TaxID=36330 RepID=A0A1A8YW70_PLAOA|nr:conserved Plasmodium protein, unknown function [Plasmodium ovale wallikeri]